MLCFEKCKLTRVKNRDFEQLNLKENPIDKIVHDFG